MNEPFDLGRMGGLKLSADKSAASGFLLLWVVFSAVGLKLFRLKPTAALTGGFISTLLHFFSELWHQAGHARAARRAGYPMEGVHLWGLLGTSIYPEDEPPLPDEIHVERAIGGPRASALLAITGGLLALLTRPLGGIAYMVTSLLSLENMAVFTLGAFLPVPFMETDGAVMRRYRDNHRRRMVTIQE